MSAADDDPLRPATAADRDELRVLYLEYKREYRAFDPSVEEHLDDPLQDDWFEKPDLLHAFVLRRGGATAGFALVLGRRYAEAVGHDADWYVYDFYVRPAARGTGLARRAAAALFARLPGTWATSIRDANPRSLGFARRALAPFADTLTVERRKAGESVFRFTAP